MKTRDLVHRLADDLAPIESNAVAKRIGRALIQGLTASTIVLVALYGVRGDMPAMMATPLFWLKLTFPLAIIVPALKLAERLGQPGAPTKRAWITALLPIFTLWLAAAIILMFTPHGYRLELMLGSTWRVSTLNIVLLSLPPLGVAMKSMKGLAPPHLPLAGAGIGLLAGAEGVLVYTLYGVEMSVPFWGIWYVLAIGTTTAIGALLGPRLLEW
ncbi:DUF1109 domain-containing protein [Dyella flava]|uniref:DUF1109 domain-containing protein n=1 Tax=Dyella flava TaxID=1920170 RepID=A0ABS2K1H3_9GAMM|nr:DUF1109 domain-containing protein [Dyella flava]MBM7124465.1 DUF1109 domain-containing protein [Dyella flava]GLQ51873.1 hypothetical protein GCM10010872_33220 [Dyella flava]